MISFLSVYDDDVIKLLNKVTLISVLSVFVHILLLNIVNCCFLLSLPPSFPPLFIQKTKLHTHPHEACNEEDPQAGEQAERSEKHRHLKSDSGSL